MPIYSKYTGVGGGTTYTFVGTAPITVTDVAGTVTTSMTQSNATTNGWLSSVDWGTFNGKQNALTIGNLTSSDISVTGGTGAVIGSGVSLSITKGNLTGDNNANISITGGTNSVLGAGTSISQTAASGSSNGYLTSANWTTFNSKQSALTFGNLTELTSSVLTITGGTGAVIGSGTTIQVTQSGVATSGYLSSTDWNTFNNKQPAGTYVTSVGATSPVASSGGTTPTISMPVATALANGYLSSADWTTFNNKADYPSQTGNVDKVLATDGTSTSWQYAGLGAGALGTSNVVLGRSKPGFTTASNVTLVGVTSGNAITSGIQHTCVGSASGGANLITGTNSTAVGYNALITGGTPSNATAIGANSTAAGDATFGGTAIGANSTADNQSVAVGKSAVAQNARNVSIGRGTTTGSAADGICIGSNITLSSSGILIAASGTAQTQSVSNSIGLYGACTVANSTLLGSTLNIFYNNHGVQRASVATLSENQIFTNSYSTGGATNNGDASGGIFTINGARGTGTGIGGDIRFKTSPPGAVSNNVQNALVEQVRITYDGKVGIGTSAPATLLHAQQTSAATNTVTDVLRVDSQSSGTPAAGIGVGIEMAAETAVGNTEIGVVLEAVTTDVTSTSEDFDFVVKNMAAGAAATETLRVTSTGNTKVTGGDLSVETVGKGLKIKEGANAKMGITGAFPTGNPNTVTVSTTAVTASSRIFLTAQSNPGGHETSLWVSTVTAGTSFVITAHDINFNGTVAYLIMEPA